MKELDAIRDLAHKWHEWANRPTKINDSAARDAQCQVDQCADELEALLPALAGRIERIEEDTEERWKARTRLLIADKDKFRAEIAALHEVMACGHPKACWQATKPDSVDAVVGYRCVACEHEAHVAHLKRQLRQALAQVEIVDRALGDPGNTSSKVALDAYVQEKVDKIALVYADTDVEFVNEDTLKVEKLRFQLPDETGMTANAGGWYSTAVYWKHKAIRTQEKVDRAVLAERKMWQSRESEEYRQALLKRAVEAEKRAEKAESNMAKAVLAESEWWHTRKIPYPNNGTVIDMGAEERLAANRAKVTPDDPPKEKL